MSLISLQLNYINLKGEKRITYLQEIKITNQKCKLPLVRASHCLPTSHFATWMIKKTKKENKKMRRSNEKEWLKLFTQGEVQSSSWGLLPSVPRKQRSWGCSLTMLVRQSQPGKHLEEHPGMLQEAVPTTHCLAGPLWWSTRGISQLHAPFAAEDLLCGMRRQPVPGGLCSLQVFRHLPQEHQGQWQVPANLSGCIKLLLLVLLLLMSDRHSPSMLRTTSLSCCCLLISSAYVTLEEAVTPVSLTFLSLSLENIFFSVKILTIIQVTHSPGNPGSWVDQTELEEKEERATILCLRACVIKISINSST